MFQGIAQPLSRGKADADINYSVKLVGLFVTSLVGLYTMEDLWEKFGDLKMSWVSQSSLGKH